MASSGVVEKVSERTKILDDIVLDIDEGADQRCIERQNRGQSDKALQEAGEKIRTQALSGVSRDARALESEFHAACNDTSGTASRKRTRRHLNEFDEEESNFIRSHLALRSAAEADRARFDNCRFDFDKEQSDRRLRVEERQVNFSERLI